MIPQLLAAVIGVWLMVAPAVLGLDEGPSNLCWILGPLAAGLGVIASSAVLRGLRWVNAIVGVAIAVGALVVGADGIALAAIGLSGLALAGVSLLGGRVETEMGGGWRYLWGDR